MSVVDSAAFADPPAQFRPMQIAHGFDRHMTDKDNLTGEEGIDRYLDLIKGMGIGGIVANVGYKDYLQSARQWEIWRYGAAKTIEMGMTLWFYDEKAYPSGTAGGVVTRAHPEYTAVGLACYTHAAEGGKPIEIALPVSCRMCEGAVAFPAGASPLDASSAAVIDLSGHVDQWGALRWTPPDGKWTVCYFARRTMFEGTFVTAIPHGDTRHYIDVLNPDAVKAFIRVTHEAYRRETPPEIWKQVQAVFTDEPLMLAKYGGSLPSERDSKQFVLDQPLFADRPPALPWTPAFAEKFQALKGYDIRPRLLSLFTGDSQRDCFVRQDYWDVATRLYVAAYHQQIADWCAANGIASSGHVLAEEGLYGNIMYEGDQMAVVRPMQLPGIDLLSANPQDVLTKHLMAPKVVSSVAHLTGRELVQCETSGHNQRIKGVKTSLGDWLGQANVLYAMGVNLLTLYHHWGAVGKDGYRAYNDYVGRLGLMLRGGHHVCDVAMLYPVRTGWAWWTPWGPWTGPALPNRDTDARRARIASRYHEAGLTLIQNQIDFDLVDERAIQEAAATAGGMRDGAMRIGAEAYRVIVLPGVEALALETARALEQFAAAGGIVMCVWETPDMADSEKNQPELEAVMARLFGSIGTPLSLKALSGALKDRIGADLELLRPEAESAQVQPDPQVCYVHRRRDGHDIYFIANNHAGAITLQPRLRARGPWKLYRPLTGALTDAPAGLRLSLDACEGVFLVN